jgi:hypothetical protein
LSKGGYPLDKFAQGYLEDLNLSEKEKIELTIDTMIRFDSRKKIDDYFKNKPLNVKTKNVKNTLKADKPCLVKASLRHMDKKTLRKELEFLIKSPKSYFGVLLEVDECKVDLFSLSEKEQVKTAKAMLYQLDNEGEKPKISLGKQKNLNLGYGDTLKVQSPYSNIKDNSSENKQAINEINMKTSKTKGKTTPKRKTGVSVAQQKSQAKIRKISDEATKIQKAGGKKTIPAKSVYKVNRATAVKQAARKLK